MGNATGAEIVEVVPGDPRFPDVLRVAASILEQDRYLERQYPQARESHVYAAFNGGRCVGFLRFLVQVIGADEARPAILCDGEALTEGFVEAFGVDPAARRVRIGSALQAKAIDYCRSVGCYQMRSRSPVTSIENYALKVAAGYTINPSQQDDSYYFLLKL